MLTVDYDRLGLEPGELVLDLGCGFGRHAYECLRRGARVVACDMAIPELHEVRNTYAILLHMTGNVRGAKEQLETALRLQPDFPEAQRNLGIAWFELGDMQKALDLWQPFLDSGQVDPMLQQLVQMAKQRLGK